MVELDPESWKYTTMALDIGRFQWTRLPMGSIVAQDFLQRKTDTIFLDIPGVTGIADDMIIYGRSNLEHDKHLMNFLEVCRKNTLTLNPDKIAVQTSTSFILWTPVECQGAESRSKEHCSSEKDEIYPEMWRQ